MNKLLEINRELREIPDPHLKSRELFIKKIEATYGYDRENAEKAYEYMKYQRGKVVLGGLCGGVAVAVARPLQRTAENYNAIFRKPWMKVPILGAAFVCGAYGGIQLPSRIFYKLTPSRNVGITHSVYTASNDMVSKFRLFETFENPNPKGNIADYLSLYGTEALTKSEMIDNIALHALKEFNVAQLFQVKRRGKDTDPHLNIYHLSYDAQQLDPAFHLLGEVERQFSDKLAVEEFRRGTEVKFSVSDKRPTHYNYRF